MSNLPEYLLLRGAMSIGKDQHFLTGVRGPVQFLLRVGQMAAGMVMLFAPLAYWLGWKDPLLLWLGGAGFCAVIVLGRWEEKWIRMPHMRGKGASAGLH